MKETLHVLGSATNARRLLESIEQADAGLLEEHPLLEHRLIYRVRGGDLEIAAGYGHYLEK